LLKLILEIETDAQKKIGKQSSQESAAINKNDQSTDKSDSKVRFFSEIFIKILKRGEKKKNENHQKK